jgi:hypothetical protein
MLLHPALAADARHQHGLFTTAQALAAGYDPKEIRRELNRGEWVRIRRGIYIEAAATSAEPALAHVIAARAVLLRLRPPVAVSHLSAAAVYGFDLLEPDFRLVHVTRPNLASSRTDAGVHHHNAVLLAPEVKRVSGLIVTSQARTLVDLAREATFEEALVAVESALNRRHVSRDQLLAAHEFGRDWPGSRNAGRVIEFASAKSESPGETIARAAFGAFGLPMPEQQVDIYDSRGLIGRVDYLWDEQSTVGELDGRIKYIGQANADVLYAEKLREDRLRALGLEVVRFGYADARRQRPELHRAVLDAFARSAARDNYRKLG